jgi:hypothetical protein
MVGFSSGCDAVKFVSPLVAAFVDATVVFVV